jgi:soluble lytic murein transglycosylase-like protein
MSAEICKSLRWQEMRRISAVVLLAVPGLAAPAHAQIYSWRDANGNLVLSDRRPPSSTNTARSYEVPRAETIRATRYAAAERSRPFEDLIDEHARLQSVRPDLVRAVMQVESAFNPRARSPKGALGLMQLMPATLRQYGVANPFDPTDNVRAGVAYLRALLDRYGNDETLALAAYNAGPTAVDRHGQAVPPYRETRNYVAQINRMVGQQPARPAGNRIYKVTETIDGRTVVRYTNVLPAAGTFEVVARSSW